MVIWLISLGACSDGTATAPDGSLRLIPVSGSDQTAPAGSRLPQPLVVRVANSAGAGVSGVAVTWRIDGGMGNLSIEPSARDSTLVVPTDGIGNSTVLWTLGRTSAAQLATAAVPSVGQVNFRATSTVGAPFRLWFTQLPSPIRCNVVLQPAIAVSVVDNAGNIVANPARWIDLKLNGHPANSLSGTTRRSTIDGIALFPGLQIVNGGLFSFVASSEGLLNANTGGFNVC